MASYELWMREALNEAKRAYFEDEVPVGAVVVKDGQIVARAHNLCEQRKDPTLHAEVLAMRQAWESLGSLEGCTLFVTLEPCAMCAGALTLMRLERLVFGAFDERLGCCGSVVNFTDHWFSSSCETAGGVLEDECSQLLKKFFSEKRCN
ncbi:MAG TPA: nucleoside deaminase [Eubacteriales bacterium]|nr:nucleoside deaminase [Clostridia bacterium]HRV73468.1 nucleoside deaminase [Eubacteriales bacterium]